ncbi:NUDIX hydrolase [Halosolutus gelatinilyticus]|uniref:NUDIX hydrolase n=1 Tax=Halosolutus gelatinilyticus TaxID=2931975 RepID=UPI001FF4D5DB|nr:NUDIX domain-containing protein [Halosolutus gelatinilyticus]
MARATVVDQHRALLIERGAGADVGSWALPGGHVDADEPPAVAAARELAEETGLSVAPADLSLLDTGFLEFESGHTMVSINYAAPLRVASGTLEAGSDAVTAAFWSRDRILEEPPLLRASGVEQVLEVIDEFGRP